MLTLLCRLLVGTVVTATVLMLIVSELQPGPAVFMLVGMTASAAAIIVANGALGIRTYFFETVAALPLGFSLMIVLGAFLRYVEYGTLTLTGREGAVCGPVFAVGVFIALIAHGVADGRPRTVTARS